MKSYISKQIDGVDDLILNTDEAKIIDQDLLNLLSVEDDCSKFDNLTSSNEHFEKLIGQHEFYDTPVDTLIESIIYESEKINNNEIKKISDPTISTIKSILYDNPATLINKSNIKLNKNDIILDVERKNEINEALEANVYSTKKNVINENSFLTLHSKKMLNKSPVITLYSHNKNNANEKPISTVFNNKYEHITSKSATLNLSHKNTCNKSRGNETPAITVHSSNNIHNMGEIPIISLYKKEDQEIINEASFITVFRNDENQIKQTPIITLFNNNNQGTIDHSPIITLVGNMVYGNITNNIENKFILSNNDNLGKTSIVTVVNNTACENIPLIDNQICSKVEHLIDANQKNNITSEIMNKNEKEKELQMIHKSCNENIKTKSLLTNFTHTNTNLIDSDLELETEFQCTQCEKKFMKKKRLRYHVEQYHKSVDEKKFKCEECEKRFTHAYQLEEHERSHFIGKYQCDVCLKKFIHKFHLHAHKKRHNSEYKLFCETCQKGFYNSTSYTNHINVVHKQLWHVCDICGCKLSTKSALREHHATHDTRTRKSICEICGKTYLNERNLKNHLKTHSKESAYCCNICGKFLSGKNILETHVRSHTGEKPIQCKICDKSFAALSYLKTHIRTHTGIKPYCCKHCKKSFSQRYSLTIHIRKYHNEEKPYSCDKCLKIFLNKLQLVKHIEQEHDSTNISLFQGQFQKPPLSTE